MKIDREELYRRVWESPVTHLAKEFDISDVGLAKACRKHEIPLPPVGYWMKLKFGKSVNKPPLPKRDKVSIEIEASRYRASVPIKRPKMEATLKVSVEPTLALEQLSPFTAATRKKLLSTKPDGYGFVTSSGADLFDCRIAVASIESACRILDAIEKSLPKIDAKLAKGKPLLEVEHGGQRLTFKLMEQFTRQQHVVRDRYYKGSEQRDYVYTFTGKFALEIAGYFEGRKRWTDGAREPLSQKLGEFVQGLAEAAQALTRRAQEMEEQKRYWAKQARLREERERDKRAMDEFRQRLLAEANASRESDVMLTYLQRLKAQLEEGGASLEPPAQEWLELAQRIAQHIDPVPRRLKRLFAGGAPEPYEGYFGKTVLASMA